MDRGAGADARNLVNASWSRAIPLIVRTSSLGALGTHCFVVSSHDSGPALVIDPGDEGPRLADALDRAGIEPVAILLTHGHFDHVGAVADLAERYGIPVAMPQGEAEMLRRIGEFTTNGFGPFRPYDPDTLLRGGEVLDLADTNVQVLSTPGHSPDGVTYRISSADGDVALFVGDVIFRGSVGRTDLDGGDWATLEGSIEMLLATQPHDAPVYSGHSDPTSLAHELASNPFLDGARARRA